jgi:prolyl oligopeptidase
MPKYQYPHTATIDQVDNYHGTLVPDPYRWLEDTDSAETRAWIETQNKLTFEFLEQIPERKALQQRLTELWDYPKAWAPLKKGSRYFQLRNTGLQNQDVLFVMENFQDEARILLDPNSLSADGTVALTAWEASPDGRWLAYASSASGSDWLSWRIRDVDSGMDLPDRIEWSKFSGAAWLPDSSGFYYSRYDTPTAGQEYQSANYYHKLYFHAVNTPQSEDKLVYERPDEKEWGFGAQVSDEGHYLVINVWQGTDVRNRMFYQDLHEGGPVVELISEREAAYAFIGNDGPIFFLRTDLDAPRGRLIRVDIRQPDKAHWLTLVPESEDVIEAVKLVQDQFICVDLHDAHHCLRCIGLDGTSLGEIPLPTLGSLVLLENWGFNAGRKDRELFFAFQSFAWPTTIYRYTLNQEGLETIFTPPIQFDFSPYVTRQVWATSKDGTRVPMFLVHRRELPAGPQPTLLGGYGGFAISIAPSFMISRLVWLERGGVLAITNLRGGGEYGEEWHRAGMLENKQNVFDDLVGCAEYLISQGLTRPDKLAIQGGSNGGLLVGACMTQRPELFGAALPAVGVMDMLRFHKFTIGWAWVSDYGSSDDPEQFKTLYAYSPLHNLKLGTAYPSTLITTADHDDRVVPGHSFKFAAALQAAQGGDAPVLIRIQTKAGHGFGKPTSIIIEEQADLWAFVIKALNIQDKKWAG